MANGGAAGLASLSQKLTETIAYVEMQRSTLEEVILRLSLIHI